MQDAAAIAAEVMSIAPSGVRTIIVDGRSGAGKTTFANLLASLVGSSASVLSLEVAYPGWRGLRAASEIVVRDVLRPRALELPGTVPLWDWSRDRVERVEKIPFTQTLIVEGCGALTHESASLADVALWLDAPAEQRRQRAMKRDGASYEPYWDLWAEQEELHIQCDHPLALADMVRTVNIPAQ